MIIPEKTLQAQIHELTQSRCSFALYRLPWTDEPILVMQREGEAETLQQLTGLNEKEGFVMAPFQVTDEHPIVLIRPDIVAHEWTAIGMALKDLPEFEPAEENSQLELIQTEESLKDLYKTAFNRFISPLKEKKFQKLVLSRHYTTVLKEDFQPLATFIKACNSYPRMMISLCHTPQTGTWIGSTPEIILSGQEEQWHTVALAGTMPMQGDVMPTEWSSKNKEEQAYVGDYIRKTIKKFGNKLTEKGPYTARAGQLVHLKTDFHFSLKDTRHLGDILYELHPTPAVCGLPKQQAYEFIPANEGGDRSYYSGIIGWLNPSGHTSLYVNLRCMHIIGTQATLYAGGGILASSTADTEWEETQQKMNTMRNIL